MIIPVKCFTCGGYQQQVPIFRARSSSNDDDGEVDKVKYLTTEQADKTPEEKF